MSDEFARTRVEYRRGVLDVSSVVECPVEQFRKWFADALNEASSERVGSKSFEPNACALATCGIDGQPSARMVLLKSIDHKGLVFFTNYMSRKAEQLAENSKAGLVFYWPSLERQVRIDGNVERIDSEESRQYFDSRPRESQIGSAVSMQSQVVSSREEMELAAQRLRDSVGEKAVPYPTNWGGFCLLPVTFEFWQGRENRLHDRIRYQKDTSGNWNLDRLWP